MSSVQVFIVFIFVMSLINWLWTYSIYLSKHKDHCLKLALLLLYL